MNYKSVGSGVILDGDGLIVTNAHVVQMATTIYVVLKDGTILDAKVLGINQFDQDVALAGRVYCKVDATEGGIEPGDLLTTSATPGYAMKATDYIRAQGAILGKAMEKLEQGKKGHILVLVTLQ